MTSRPRAATRRGLGRSVRLFRAFLVEQSDPHRFYSALADDSIAILAEHVDLDGARVLDVGAGPSEFADAFLAAGAHYVPLDADASVPSVRGGGVVADAGGLPVASGPPQTVRPPSTGNSMPVMNSASSDAR